MKRVLSQQDYKLAFLVAAEFVVNPAKDIQEFQQRLAQLYSGGHYPPREQPQPPKIHRPAHAVEQERQAAQRANQEQLEAALADVPKHINDLHAQSGIDVGVLLASLCQLELQGRVRRYPGERYARIAAA